MEKEKLTKAWKENKKSKQNAKRVIFLAKGKKQKECASDLNNPNQQNEIFQIATHTHNRFTALLEYVRDHPGEQVPERLKPIWIYWSKR